MNTHVFIVIKHDRRIGVNGEPELHSTYSDAEKSANEYLKWYAEPGFEISKANGVQVGIVQARYGDGFSIEIYRKLLPA
jgi:hypothetical protein